MELSIKNLSFRYPNNYHVFSDVNLTLKTGEILTILGPNGAGKSTLLNCIANLDTPYAGSITIDRKNIDQMNPIDFAKLVGYVPQIHIPTYSYTVREFVVMGRAAYIGAFKKPSKQDYQMVDEVLELLEISYLKEKAYTEISGGERQQATIARVIVQQPQFILLDEPTAHLDFGNQSKTIKQIKKLSQLGFGIIMTTHNPDHIFSLNSKVGVLKKGGEFITSTDSSGLNETFLSELYKETIYMEYSKKAQRNICITEY